MCAVKAPLATLHVRLDARRVLPDSTKRKAPQVRDTCARAPEGLVQKRHTGPLLRGLFRTPCLARHLQNLGLWRVSMRQEGRTMQLHRMILGLALGASLGLSCSDDDDLNECQDACADTYSTCLDNCGDANCTAGCQVAQTSCLDACE